MRMESSSRVIAPRFKMGIIGQLNNRLANLHYYAGANIFWEYLGAPSRS